MAQELFYFVVHPNGVIVRREKGASFESSAPAITAEDRLEYRPSWISEDSHVRMTFEVHKRVMEDKVMVFYAEVRHAGSSSRLSHPGPSTDPAPSHVVALEDVAMRGDNSGEDSDYEEDSSSDSTEEDEEVLDTPVGWTRLVLPPPLPIPDLAQVPICTAHGWLAVVGRVLAPDPDHQVVPVRAPPPHPDHPLPLST
ncbi:hypothetical protein PIB30_028604 [Stylosanthes scabra]|uniref:Uncharacterized protein n=1 Tax=Stylosanthes scabra TaxID=79078 RepID=A0ABU6X8L6_9FABA|nr:hypothetical protein [Stylosanthes scabra]